MTNTPTQAAIEAAARALASWEGADWNAASFIGTPNGDEPDDMRAGYLEAATAAIEAYRAAMREAGLVEVNVSQIAIQSGPPIYNPAAKEGQ